jgi:hypothetical protein
MPVVSEVRDCSRSSSIVVRTLTRHREQHKTGCRLLHLPGPGEVGEYSHVFGLVALYVP